SLRYLVVTLSTCSYIFFSSRRRHTRSKRDWSSDVCSSDLFQPSLVESPLGCGALDASWLGVNGDHIRANLLYRAARMDGVCGVLTALRLHTCHHTHNP